MTVTWVITNMGMAWVVHHVKVPRVINAVCMARIGYLMAVLCKKISLYAPKLSTRIK
jgi:hypothetical protein